jgi:iron complex outermembrane recepter protein
MRILSGLLCVIVSLQVHSQQLSHVLKGRVVDRENGLPLRDVHIFMHEAEISAFTDTDGYFTLTGLGEGEHHVHIERIGYRADARYVRIPLPQDSLWRAELSPTAIELNQVVVEHSLGRSASDRQPLDIIRIGADELDKTRELTLARSLSRIAGVQVIQTGVSIARPVIRGFSGNRILVQDLGMKQEGQQWGNDHGLDIDPYGVSRMEVIKGPGTLMFGPDAMGGVLHILPPAVPAPGMRGSVHLAGRTSNNLAGSSVMLEGNRSGRFFRARFTVQEYGDYKVPADRFTYLRRTLPIESGRLKNTAGKEMHGALTTGIAGKWGSVKWTNALYHQRAGLFPGIVGVPTAASVADDGDARNVDLPRFAIDHFKSAVNAVLLRPRGWLQVDLGVQQNVRAELIRPRREGFGPLADSPEAYRLRLRTAQVTTRWHRNSEGPWKWIPGMSAQWMQHGKSGYELLLPEYTQWTAGAFVTGEYRANDRSVFSLGVRFDGGRFEGRADSVAVWAPGEVLTGYDRRMDKTDALFGAFSGGFGWSLTLREGMQLRTHIGKSFRPPNAAERTINGIHHGTFRHEQGDPSMRPEHGYQADLTWSLETRRAMWKVSPWVNYFEGYIYLRPTASFSELTDGGQVYRYTRHDALFAGFELQAEYHPVAALHLEWTADYVWNYNMETGLALPFTPPLRGQFYAEYELEAADQDSRWRGFYAGIRQVFVAGQNRTDRNERMTSGYTLTELSAGATVRANNQTVDIRLFWSNVFNTNYFNHLSIYRQLNLPEQGSNIGLLIKVPFEFH